MNNRVTDIQIIPINPKDGLVGFASFVFDDSFYFGSIGIYTRPHGGFRLTYPTRKVSGQNLHIYHPINKDIANLIEKSVISKFEEITASEGL
jgi:DNA-binding cell septation regulator SpoVG